MVKIEKINIKDLIKLQIDKYNAFELKKITYLS